LAIEGAIKTRNRILSSSIISIFERSTILISSLRDVSLPIQVLLEVSEDASIELFHANAGIRQ